MEFTEKIIIKATAKELYVAWLNSKTHSEMTGGEAEVSDVVGDTLTAWDGYIEGRNLVLEPYNRIVQAWRTSEFNEDEPDSEIEILLVDKNGETELTLIHRNLPESGEQYRKGWSDFYFTPMKAYFNSAASDS